MDASIRQLISISNTVDEESGVKLVIQAYNSLQEAFNKSKNDDGLDTCGSDLYVQCAEVAFKLKQIKISQECLHMYFNGTPLTNQFLCRAYLCQAQLLSPTSAEDVVDFETAVVYLLKAINFAKDKTRYQFIVYNASVLYWQMARPFLRSGYKGVLHQSLQQVVQALEDIEDSDHEWRASLMIALIESYVDGGFMKEASSASQAASQFTLNKTPVKFKDVLTLQIKHKLVDLNKLAREVSGMPEYSAFFKLQKLKSTMDGKSKSDTVKELQKLVGALSGKILPTSKPSTRESRRKSSQDDAVSFHAEDSTTSSSRSSSVASRKSSHSKMSLIQKPDPVSIPLHCQEQLNILIRPYLLIDVARLCAHIDQVSMARMCLSTLKECEIMDSSLLVEIEFVECEMMVKLLGDKQEAYTKSSVQVRLAAIKRMDQALQNAVRSGNANVVQGACATQWNLCLPLLQRNLRKHVRRSLTAVAQALEDISSLQVMLRCQVHTELAKCEEAVEQIEAAVKHVNKALKLDDSGFYYERLQTMLHRLQLSTQLYRTPDRAEDVAAIIIEQARKSSDSGSVHMKRSLLVKAGLALAPDAFQYVLDSENEMKATGGTKGLVSAVQILAARAKQWQKCVRKAPGHLKRLGDENDRERARLWVDLVKTARQQHVWDVCRVASTFCLLYDDARWKIIQKGSSDGVSKDKRNSLSQQGGKRVGRGDSASIGNKTPIADEEKSSDSNLHDADLLRMLAEVHFISGEALIHLLRCEGLKLNESPVAPTDTRQRPKGHEYKKPEEEPEWAVYTDWIHHLNQQATNGFVRATELGIELEETWIICSGAVYLWNYNNHLITDARYTQLVPTFEKILFGMQEIGHSSESALLVRICDVIAKGLLSPWLPKKVPTDSGAVAQTATTTATKDTNRKKTAAKGGGNAAPATAASVSVDPEATDDLKKAIEVCEYGLQVTNGANITNLVPTEVRHQLLSTWVQLKQMLQQQISPNFGTDNEKLSDQRDMTKALVMLEVLSLNHNQMMEFIVPEISEVCDIVEECNWDDPCVELEVWTRLAKLSRLQKNHSLVVRCTAKALALMSSAVKKKQGNAKQATIHKRTVALEMLSYAACILGESLMDTCAANPSARRQAMHSFVDSAKYGEEAKNFGLVMAASRRWWNSALPLIPSPLERELLRKPLEALLNCILHSASNVQFPDETEETKSSIKEIVKICEDDKSSEGASKQSIGVSLGDPADDRALRAAMYGVLFQTYADKGEWEEGLVVMDRALHHMPRTKHRLLLFKHRVIVKAKLGKNVQMDIAKFRDESEDYVSHMWHRVALCSRNTLEQLLAFQQSVEALYSEDTQWQKFEYLLELATWMYCNEFKIADSVNVIEWACDILIGMKFEVEIKEEKQLEKGKGKKGKASKPVSRGPPKPDNKPSSRQRKKTPESKQTKREESKKEEQQQEEQQQHVPVEREAVIGVEANNLNIKVEDLRSTRQLEGLIRSHVMMATISGKGTKEHTEYCQLAYSFVMRLWKISLASAAVVMKQLPKPDTTAEDGRKTSGGKKAVKPTPATNERSKRKGSPDAIPTSTSDWATYEASHEIKQAFLFDSSECGINKQTITCAGMTVFYLVKLSDYLCDCALNHLSLPVLSLASVITQGILQSDSWSQLINIKQIITCYELHLDIAAQHWESLIDNKYLTEHEQMLSRQDLESKQIHKELAKQEEERIRKANGGDIDIKNAHTRGRGKSVERKKEEPGPITLTGRKVGCVNYSEIWTEKAKQLLRLGHYQVSRTLLNEALTVANYNNDDMLKAEIYHGYADLAIHEGNTGQAFQLLKKSQLIGGDELFWQDNISLLINAITLNQDPSPEDLLKVIKVIKHSMVCLNKLEDMRPTKLSTIGYMKATLTVHACFLRLSNQSNQVTDQLNKLEKAEHTLHDLGFYRKLSHIHMEHADILVRLSKTNKHMKHSYLLKAIEIVESSVANMSSICINVLPLESDKDVSLPVHREMMNLQLHLCHIMLYAAELSADEDRFAKAEEDAKGILQRTVEEYVGKSEYELNDVEQMWNKERITYIHRSLSLLNTLHTMLPKQHVMRAQWLYLIGRSLRLLGDSNHPDHPECGWNISNYLSEQILHEVAPQSSTGLLDSSMSVTVVDEVANNGEIIIPTKQQKKLSQEATKLMEDSEFANRLLSHASEVLAQCINIALQLQATDIVSKASLEMVECSAQSDPSMSAIYLALHQSAESSKTMKNLLMKSISDPTTSQFSSLVHQESWLMKNYISTGLHACTLRKDVLKVLDDNFTTWKRLQLSPNYLDLMKDLPPTFNIMILQHSVDRNMLYCGLLDKPKPSASPADAKSKGKDKPSVASPESRAFVMRMHVDRHLYDEMMDQHSDYQQRLMSFLLQSEYQRSQLAMRQKMLQQLSKNAAEAIISQTTLEEQAMEEMKLKEEFDDILNDMETYLSSVTSQIKLKLVQTINEQAEQQLSSGQPLSELPPEIVMLLAGPSLMRLPLEALHCFQTPHIDVVCRDFSLQLLHKRWYVDPDEALATAEKKKNEIKNTPKTPKGGRDAGKKDATPAAKIVPLNRELPQGCASIDTHSVHYIVDPHNDCSETEQYRPDQVLKQLIQLYGQSFTPRWAGFYGTDGLPSIGQWEESIQNCSSFIFYGMERFIAQFPPSKLSALNLNGCQFMLLLDKSQTNKSFRYQSKVDVDKTNNLLSIEKPLETAMLVSLCGANSVCLNQWHTTSEDNASKLQVLMESILEEGKMLGQAVRKIINPTLKKPDPPAEEEAVTPVAKDKTDGKGKRKDSVKAALSKSRSDTAQTSTPGPILESAQSSYQFVDDEPVKKLDASWCNMILFGLPNMIVT